MDTTSSAFQLNPLLHFFVVIKKSGIVGFLFLFFFVFIKFFQRKRGIDDYDTVDQSSLFQIFYIVLMFGIAFIKSLNLRNPTYSLQSFLKNPPLIWLTLYIIWASVTLFWSPQFKYSGWRVFENIAYFYVMLSIIRCFQGNLDDAVHFVLYYGLFSYCALLFFYFLGGGGLSIAGFHGMGALTTCPLLFLALYYPTRLWLKFFYLVITLLSTATTMYITVVLIAFMAIFTSKRKFLHIILIAGAFVLALVANPEKTQSVIFAGKSDDAIATGSGRTLMFEEFFNAAMVHPWRGWGFSCANIATRETGAICAGINIANTHNCLLEAFVTTGVPGTVLLTFFFLTLMIIPLIRLGVHPIYLSLFYCGVGVTIVSLLNPSVSGRVFGAWIPTVFIAILLVQTSIATRHR